MADPVTIALVGTTLARTFVDVQAGNARVESLRRRAAAKRELADRRFAADRREAARDAAALRARFAARGVALAGSPLLALEDEAATADYRARMRRFETLNEGANLLDRADGSSADRARTLLGAGRNLLAGP